MGPLRPGTSIGKSDKNAKRQLGKAAAKLLYDRLGETRLLDELYPRILAVTPGKSDPVTDAKLLPMFSATAAQYAMCFGSACLAFHASEIFAKRVVGLIPVPDKEGWGEFTEGVLEYATDRMKHPATRGDIIEDINDYASAVDRFCRHYGREATPIIKHAAEQIQGIVREVLDELRSRK